MNETFFFRQLFDNETSTYTYVIADNQSRDAIIIDSVLEQAERDIELLEQWELNLKYTLDTHIHADHVTGADRLRKAMGAKTAVGKASGVHCADLLLEDGDGIEVGGLTLTAISTPGHTDSCTSFVLDSFVFTGDCLLIRGCGRTDFQQGDSRKLYQSVTDKLWKLPDATRVYPGHNYRGIPFSTIGEEKCHNPRLKEGTTEEQFVTIMKNLSLDPPKKIEIAVPRNLQCGAQ